MKIHGYDEIIYQAILNHNKREIEKGLTNRELLHSKIIRDADKTDIFYVSITDTIENIYGCTKKEMEHSEVTEEIMREFEEEKSIDYGKRKTYADRMISHFVFVYDFNFNYGLRVIKEKHYLEKLFHKVVFEKEDTKKKLQKVYQLAKDYIEEKLGEKHGKENINY